MASERKPHPENEREALREDDLVRFTGGAACTHGTYLLKEWLGKSPQAGFWWIYPTPELDEYVEIAESDITPALCWGSPAVASFISA